MKKIIYSIIFASFLLGLLGFTTETYASSNLDKELENKGYSQSEISSMNNTTKEKLANSNGQRADYTVTTKEYYNSLDGKKYEVTEANREEINKIMKNDFVKYYEENGISVVRATPSSVSINSGGDYYEDNKLSVSAFVDLSTTNSVEYTYYAFLDFAWDEPATVQWTDHLGLAWDNRFIGLANTLTDYLAWTHILGNNWVTGSLTPSQEIYGIKGRFLVPNSGTILGGISQQVKVPVRYKNETAKFQAKYVHTLVPFTGAINLGPASVNVPTGMLCQEFVLDFNLNIGS